MTPLLSTCAVPFSRLFERRTHLDMPLILLALITPLYKFSINFLYSTVLYLRSRSPCVRLSCLPARYLMWRWRIRSTDIHFGQVLARSLAWEKLVYSRRCLSQHAQTGRPHTKASPPPEKQWLSHVISVHTYRRLSFKSPKWFKCTAWIS